MAATDSIRRMSIQFQYGDNVSADNNSHVLLQDATLLQNVFGNFELLTILSQMSFKLWKSFFFSSSVTLCSKLMKLVSTELNCLKLKDSTVVSDSILPKSQSLHN